MSRKSNVVIPSIEQLKTIVKDCHYYYQVINKLGWYYNFTSLKRLKKLILISKIDISHFDKKYGQRKYKIVIKNCPICKEQFQTKLGGPREKITCGYSCANTMFRSGVNNGQFINGSKINYRTLCFHFYEKKCLICDWDISVDVHHIDMNRENNNIENLVPLCPNHHRMIHKKKYKTVLVQKIKECLLQKYNV